QGDPRRRHADVLRRADGGVRALAHATGLLRPARALRRVADGRLRALHDARAVERREPAARARRVRLYARVPRRDASRKPRRRIPGELLLRSGGPRRQRGGHDPRGGGHDREPEGSARALRDMIETPGGLAMRFQISVLALSALGAAAVLRGDDVTGKDRLLCTAVQSTQCTPDGECKSAPPWELNIPQFQETAGRDRTATTTRASGENRSSPIGNISREGGLIIFQGVQNGRAFSFVIAESSGMASIAVAREGLTVSIFGACTPTPEAK